MLAGALLAVFAAGPIADWYGSLLTPPSPDHLTTDTPEGAPMASRRTLIGLDIGSASIRAVETRRGKDGRVVTNFGQVPLPHGAVQGGVVQRRRRPSPRRCKQLWADHQVPQPQASCSA